MRDFDDRCAYSLLHTEEADGMEVDHFNPTLKEKFRHAYSNLMPAFRSCNRAKSDIWPTASDISNGIRLLDPTKEMDYGVQIFEDPETHRLQGETPSARYHIRVLNLNSSYLIGRRRLRSQLRQLLQNTPATYTGAWAQTVSQECRILLRALIDHVEKMIPTIPAPPKEAQPGKTILDTDQSSPQEVLNLLLKLAADNQKELDGK